MCRLLGVVSRRPATVAASVGDQALREFVDLTRFHGDGWGLAQVAQPHEPPSVVVSATSAQHDPTFRAAASQEKAVATIAHLRWATSNYAVAEANCHPFVADGIAMAHNGSIKPVGDLQNLLEPAFAKELCGTTDSERYFALIRQSFSGGTDLPEAVLDTVRLLRSAYPDASLNALVLDGTRLIAVHAQARSQLHSSDIDRMTQISLPADHIEDYFSLRVARPNPDTVVIGSTGFGDLPWRPFPPETVTTICLRTLTMRSCAL